MSRAEGAADSGGLGAPFWRLFASSSASNLSDGVTQIAIPLLAAAITRDPVSIAIVGAMAYLPWLLLGLPMGAVVDRVDRRFAMAFANGLRAVVVGGLAAIVALGTPSVAVLGVAAFLFCSGEVVYDAATRSIVMAVLPTNRLDKGNSLLTTTEMVGQGFLGAPIGSALFTFAAAAPFFGSSVGFALSAVVILTLRGNFRTERTAPTTLRGDIAEGFRWLRGDPFMRKLTLITSGLALLQALPSSLLVLFALEVLHLSASGFGWLVLAAAIGGVVGSLAAPGLGRRFGRVASLVASATIGPAAVVASGLIASPWVVGVLFAVASSTVAVWKVLSMSIRQVTIPTELFGRVLGAYRMIALGAFPFGVLVGGVLAGITSVATVIVVSGVARLLLVLPVWRLFHGYRDHVSAAFARREQLEPADD